MDEDVSDNGTLCLKLTNDDLSTYAMFQWWVTDLVERVIGVAGIFANIAAIIVLSQRQMASNFNYLLMFLATCDVAVIVLALLDDFNNKLVQFCNYHFCKTAHPKYSS